MHFIGQTEFDSLPQQEQQNLQSDGIHNQEILFPSNIEDICLDPTNPKCPLFIESAMTSPGMMLYITGMNESLHPKVFGAFMLHYCGGGFF